MLTREATTEELISATARNHTSWFAQNALLAGGTVEKMPGLTRILAPSFKKNTPGELVLAFPELDLSHTDTAIDTAIATARQNSVRQIGCWSCLPTQPTELGLKLMARGFQWGWQPHWMALDLFQLSPVEHRKAPNGLEIFLDDGASWGDVSGLPYYDPSDAPCLKTHAEKIPRETYHFGARWENSIVGHSLVHLTSGEFGVAGIYNVSVLPNQRNQGIGRAISLAACQCAKSLGYRYAVLNAATHIYERLGFVSLGHGQTWWLFSEAIAAPALTPELIAWTEAIGSGDVDNLSALVDLDLDAALRCQLTPLELAARFHQPKAAQWLLSRGALPDVIPMCDLGWREQIPELLHSYPQLANRQLGQQRLTPLHEAIVRNDFLLFECLLQAKPDLTIRDTAFHGTASDWARHFQRNDFLALIHPSESNHKTP
jgi:GNAT superfamily N-acetyltransferase